MGKVTTVFIALLFTIGCDGTIRDDPGGDPMLPDPSVHENTPEDIDDDGIPDYVIPAAGALRRLTVPQYVNSIRDNSTT